MAQIHRSTLFLLAAAAHAMAQPPARDIGVWAGLMATPRGAFVPVDPLSRDLEVGATRWAARGSRWALTNNAHNTVVGATLYKRSSETAVASATIGYFRPGCDCSGVAMFGGEVSSPKRVWEGTAAVAEFDAAFGAGYGRDSENNYFSAALSLPFSVAFGARSHSRFNAFFNPGVAAASRASEIGTAFTLGGGVGWTSGSGTGVQIGASRVLLDGTGTTFGATLLWHSSRR